MRQLVFPSHVSEARHGPPESEVSSMWVKICANTNLYDAMLASELGADAVGFVFAPSKRRVVAEQVATIVPNLPAATEKIGVFTLNDAAEIAAMVRTTGLTGIQLHGGLDLELARRVRSELGADVIIIQTLHWNVDAATHDAQEVAAQLRDIAGEPAIDRVLVDAKTAKASGGGGIPFDWKTARAALAEYPEKLIVAGGLTPENVAQAIATLQPWGVDVASSVEATPGIKDPERLLRFINNAGGSGS